MYYQKDESETINIIKSHIFRDKDAFFYKNRYSIFIFAGLAALGLFTYSTNYLNVPHAMNSELYESYLKIPMKYGELDEYSMIDLFKQYKTNFSRSYETDDEETLRYTNFKNFLTIIDKRNEDEFKYGSGKSLHGITKFADLTEDEFKKGFLGYRPTYETNAIVKEVDSDAVNRTVVNWANIYTTAVKDQGYCGSCWAFSATEQIESDSIRVGLLTVDDALSPEQIVQCDNVDYGCEGGNTDTAFEYVMNAGGIETDADYPYTSYYDVTGECSSDTTKYVVTVNEYYSLKNEDDMIAYTLSTGPLSVCVAASTWSSYVSGIITTCDTDVDHCVQAVGVNTEEGYWIVRNSWGTDWGLDGYIWLETGVDMCMISYDPKYVTTSLV